MKTLEEQFHGRLSAFLRRTGLRPTTFGMKALGDPNLIRQIRAGRSPSLRTADRVLDFMAAYERDPRAKRIPSRPRRNRRSSSRARRTPGSRAKTEQPADPQANPPTRLMRLPRVQARTGLSRGAIYARMAEGRFPRPISLGARAVAWIEAEVDAWIRERIEERRNRLRQPGSGRGCGRSR